MELTRGDLLLASQISINDFDLKSCSEGFLYSIRNDLSCGDKELTTLFLRPRKDAPYTVHDHSIEV